uniref:Uncharacterized protein n=1 Tax=Arion vulgaris TaxID=1028688 RepID=A0A0B6YPP4_9EUPU
MSRDVDFPTNDASSSDVIDFNFALDEENDEEHMELQTMPQPQLVTTGLERGDNLALSINVAVGEVDGWIFCWLLVTGLELLLLLEKE